MSFVPMVKEGFKVRGPVALELKMPFDEIAFVNDNINYIKKSLDMQDVTVKAPEDDATKEKVKPGEPLVTYQ